MNPDDYANAVNAATSVNITHNPLSPVHMWDNTYPQDTLIKGKMVVAELVISEHEFATMGEAEVKKLAALELAYELLKSNCIEFTRTDDPLHLKKRIRARSFVVPNTDVQILREKGY